MQRIACALIGVALFVVCCLVGLLLGDALAAGRVPPMLAFYAACGAGVSLILGLAMLERRPAPSADAPWDLGGAASSPQALRAAATRRDTRRRHGGQHGRAGAGPGMLRPPPTG